MKLPYNDSDKQSILSFAKKLRGKTLRDSCDKTILEHKYSGKGNFGQVLEKFYFMYEPNSDAQADFVEVGLELKSSALKKLKNSQYRAKERLSLNIINYQEVINQNFETSSFWRKNSNLLLVFYLHEIDSDILDYIIKLVDEWNFPINDLKIIKKDWEIIKKKVFDGKAHELSEGDTYYLGACTKGSKGGNLRKQPNNTILAKQRAYSLKQGYVNHIIASISQQESLYGKLLTHVDTEVTIEEIVIEKFENYYNKSIEEIVSILKISFNQKAKNFYANLTKTILGIEFNKEIEEFEKANILVKTVRLGMDNMPKEDMSFPMFKYEEIINQEWDESDIKSNLEQKFLFVFFQYKDNELILKKVKFWNMPYKDIVEVKRVWDYTKKLVSLGEIIKKVVKNKSGKEIRYTNFPGRKFSNIAHVRPHARNTADTVRLPVMEKLTKANEYTKHCFWLNSVYIKNHIFLKK